MCTSSCRRFAWIATLLASPHVAIAQPDLYDFQERCGKQAREWFQTGFKDGVERVHNGKMLSSFQNHYSLTLKRCFILTANVTIETENGKRSSSTMRTLLDINDNRELGFYFKRGLDAAPFQCEVNELPCRSDEEWQELLKPYLED